MCWNCLCQRNLWKMKFSPSSPASSCPHHLFSPVGADFILCPSNWPLLAIRAVHAACLLFGHVYTIKLCPGAHSKIPRLKVSVWPDFNQLYSSSNTANCANGPRIITTPRQYQTVPRTVALSAQISDDHKQSCCCTVLVTNVYMN